LPWATGHGRPTRYQQGEARVTTVLGSRAGSAAFVRVHLCECRGCTSVTRVRMGPRARPGRRSSRSSRIYPSITEPPGVWQGASHIGPQALVGRPCTSRFQWCAGPPVTPPVPSAATDFAARLAHVLAHCRGVFASNSHCLARRPKISVGRPRPGALASRLA